MKQELDTLTFEDLIEDTKNYVESNVELLKLKLVDKTSTVGSSIISILAIAIFILTTLMLLSVGVAMWLGKILGEYYYGFFLIAGFLTILIIIIYIFREKWLKMPVANSIIENMSK